MVMNEALVACVALAAAGSLQAVRVAAFSPEEHTAGGAGAWGQSQHHVFQ